MYIAIAIAIALLFPALFMSPVKILSKVSLIDGQSETLFRISFWGLNFNLPKAKKEQAELENKKDTRKTPFDDFKKTFDGFYNVLKILKSDFHVTLFSFKARVGLGDAAETGIATGISYSVLYTLLGVLDKSFDLQKHHVSISPVFTEECFDFEFEGRFKLRLLHCLRLLKRLN